MNRQEFEDTARRYREELFRMYASQNVTPQPLPQARRPAAEPQPPAKTIAQPVQAVQPMPAPPQKADRPAEPDAPAEPVMPALPAEPEPDAPDEPALPKRAYTGCIRVHAVTAEGALPVAGAFVTVTRFTDGEPELVALQMTDASGETETMTVPSPPPSADQRHPASFLYDISVQAAGFYREHSTDVPVFPDVTSVQTFNLIPLPAGESDPVSGGDLTYYNNMQQY